MALTTRLNCDLKQFDSDERRLSRPRDPIGSLTRLRQPVPWPFRRRAREMSFGVDTRQHATHIAFSRLGSALFARRYWGHPVWFLFLRLMICLSSAGFLAGDIVE